MSPEPYVRWQAYATLAALLLVSTLGSPVAGLVCMLTVAVVAFGLWAKYRGDVGASGLPVSDVRTRLDRIVLSDSLRVLGLGVLGTGVTVATGAIDTAAPEASFVLIAAATASIYLSSLVDWYVILPRVSGQLGP